MGVRGVESRTFRTSDLPFVKKCLDEKRGEEENNTCYVVLLVKVCFLWCNGGKLSGTFGYSDLWFYFQTTHNNPKLNGTRTSDH